MNIHPWIRESNLIEDIDNDAEDMRSQMAWDWFRRRKKLTIKNILKVHDLITRNQLGEHAGRFRKCRVWIGGHEGIPHKEIEPAMETWLRLWNTILGAGKRDDAEAALWIKSLHVKFEKIHPFIDGNGRTGRMIMNWQRTQQELPPLLLKASERWAYYEWFMERTP